MGGKHCNVILLSVKFKFIMSYVNELTQLFQMDW